MELIQRKYKNYHVSLDTISEFERIVLRDSSVKKAEPAGYLSTMLARFIWYIIKKLPIKITVKLKPFFRTKNRKNCFFCIILGNDFSKCFPHYMRKSSKNIYIFDAWPSLYTTIEKFVIFYDIDNVFVSSMQSSIRLKDKIPTANFYWTPEGINLEEYINMPYDKKDIDVLAMGRKYDLHHNKIKQCLESNNIKYFYEKVKGKVIFPDRKAFIYGLARAKISICFPSNITHPERSGTIETVTIRYFQSMASKCLLLGSTPEELITLFGYNPVVEADMTNPDEQILSILNNFEAYIPLIEKNYSAISNHSWTKRWETVKNIMDNQ